MSGTRSSKTTSLYEEAWLPGPGGLYFYTRTYRPPPSTRPKAIYVFIHGFADHSTRHERDHLMIAANGFIVFTYDQRGFGRTALDGEQTRRSAHVMVKYGRTSARNVFEDTAWWVRYALQSLSKEGQRVFLMGYSAVRAHIARCRTL